MNQILHLSIDGLSHALVYTLPLPTGRCKSEAIIAAVQYAAGRDKFLQTNRKRCR